MTTAGAPTARAVDPVGARYLVLVAGLTLAVLVRYAYGLRGGSTFQDLRVYLQGADAVVHGVSPYRARTGGHGDLVFTYPPFAAVVFAPLLWLPSRLAPWVFSCGSVVGLCGLVTAFTRRLQSASRISVVVVLAGLLTAPVFRTVQQGQVNLLLGALVAVDLLVLRRGSRSRGVFIGVAAAVKVVPGAFVLVLLAQRDRASVIRAGSAWLGSLIVGWLVAPGATSEYFRHLLFDTSRSGGGGYPDNESMAGVLSRILHTDHPSPLLLLPLQVAVLSLGYLRARAAVRGGRDEWAVLLVALAALLASPVSWSHHWVWCVPLAMTLWHDRKTVQAVVVGVASMVPPLALSAMELEMNTPRPLWLLSSALMALAALLVLVPPWRAPEPVEPRRPAPVGVA